VVKNLLQSLDYSVLQQCMHCGLCLPSCPTYAETGRERNSPRGRIALMRAVADGELETTVTFAKEMSYCLGCLACTTACPAGVDYAALWETARAQSEQSGVAAAPSRRFIRWFTMRFLFTHPRTLRLAGRVLWFWRACGLQALVRHSRLTAWLPRRLRELEPQTPRIARRFSDGLIAEVEYPKPFTVKNASDTERGKKAHGSALAAPSAVNPKPHYRVAVLTGCVQDLVFSDVNRATVDVLLANGCEVVTPRAQPCCGSLHAHNGDLETARELARRQLGMIDPDKFDAIISNAAGCGSHLKHYGRLLAGDPACAARAAAWSRKVRDISEWLAETGFRKPEAPAFAPRPITYHEACHLCHGQKISSAPREVLRAIPGLELRECAEATWCCGSAGVYNLTQPRTAAWLLQRKLGHLRATGAEIVAAANPGCQLQLENGFRATGENVAVIHPVVLLARAYAAETQGS